MNCPNPAASSQEQTSASDAREKLFLGAKLHPKPFLPAEVSSRLSGSFEWWFLTFDWELTLDPPSIVIKVKALGIDVGTVTLTPESACAEVTFNIQIVKAELEICADFASREITLRGKACRLDWNGWDCDTIDLVIATWPELLKRKGIAKPGGTS